MKLHAFDFDKTLTNVDTIFGFYKQTNKRNFFFVIKHSLLLFAAIIYKLKLIDNEDLKKIGVKLFLVGKSRIEIINGAKEYSKKIKLNQIYFNNFLTIKKEQRIIISASFEEYLEFIFPEEKIVGSRLSFKNDKVTGLDRNMYGSSKSKFLLKNNIEKLESFYTDSYSDLPLMKMASNIYLIEKGKPQRINLTK